MTSSVVAYYQDPDDLRDVSPSLTHLVLCSIHFGPDYIHLNNYPPDAKENDLMWQNIQDAYDKGVRIELMIGGAGGAFQAMFKDFEKYYGMFHALLDDHPEIESVNLDVEEQVSLMNIGSLVQRLKKDFPNLGITFAPTIDALISCDDPGMGGFCYRNLELAVGKLIDRYYVQAYNGSFTSVNFQHILNNGFLPQRLVMGFDGCQGFDLALEEVKHMQSVCHHALGGVFVWNYHSKPLDFAKRTKEALDEGKGGMCSIM